MKKKSAICLILIILVLTIYPFLRSGSELFDDDQNEGANFLSTASLDEEIGYEWNRTWGTSSHDSGRGVAIDSLDNIYFAGLAWDTFIGHQAALIKYDTSGNIIWSRTWDGVHDARGHAVAVDSFDNIYMGGYGSFGPVPFDLFVVKYNSAGTVQWSRTWGGSDYERIYGLAVDSSDNVYLVGETVSWGPDRENMVIVKYNSAGTLQWNRTWGLSGFDIAYAVGCDNSDNVYMVGTTTSFIGGLQWNIVKYNSAGTLLWNRTWGYWGNNYAYGITFDSSDNVFIAGERTHPTRLRPGVAIVKFDSSGNELYNQTWNEIGFWGNQEIRARDIVLDASENIYLSCFTGSDNIIGGTNYMGVFKFNTSGDAQGFVRWDKSNTAAYGIALDSNENIYIGGQSDDDLCLVKYNLVPQIAINSPNENDFFGSIAPDFDISITDSDLDTRWYTIDEGLTNITFVGLTGTVNQAEWDTLSDGPVNLTFYTNDTAGNIASANVVISKDASDPQITVNAPLNSEVFGGSAPNFDISIVEPNLDSTWYTIDNGITNITFSGLTGTIDQVEWDKLLNGSVTLTFYANDTVGNIGSAGVSIYKDVNIPQITINSPFSSEFFGTTAPGFDITITELNLDSTWYTIDNGITNITFSGLTGTIDQTEWDAAGEGAITITFYANDTSGNIGNSGVTINKDTIIPQIVINSPTHEQNFGSTAPSFNITITEVNLNYTWYSLEGSIINTTFSGLLGSINQTEWDKIAEEGIYITFYAKDYAGNIGSAEVLVVKDTINPQITIYGPIVDEFFGVDAPAFDIFVEDHNLNSTWYTLDGGLTNITFIGDQGTIDQSEWDKISSSGPVTITFFANDTLGRLGFAQVTIYKDIDAPSSQLVFIPHSGTNVVTTSTIFTFTEDDGVGSGVSVIRYKINDSAWMDYTGGFDLSGFAAGSYNISYYAIDEAGNIENINSFIVDLVVIPPGQPPPISIEMIILISVIGGVAVIAIAALVLLRRKGTRITN